MKEDTRMDLALSRHRTNRRAELRESPTLWEYIASQPQVRVLCVHRASVLLRNHRIEGFTLEQVYRFWDIRQEELMFLGETTVATDTEPEGTVYLAYHVSLENMEDVAQDGFQWEDLRSTGHLLSDRDAGLATQALALANWHETYQYSPQTGQQTLVVDGGWSRKTAAEKPTQYFPRTDPAIIVLITDSQDRLLLGNNALWEKNRFSLLAGFVEPGESLEEAVIREVYEESGLVVENPQYLTSQPWPFPRSLMLGFHAQVRADVDPNALRADGVEILSLKWFSKQELLDNLGEIVLPGKTSLSRAMIEHWLGQPIEHEQKWD
jgi:NAD+ diphosphatase